MGSCRGVALAQIGNRWRAQYREIFGSVVRVAATERTPKLTRLDARRSGKVGHSLGGYQVVAEDDRAATVRVLTLNGEPRFVCHGRVPSSGWESGQQAYLGASPTPKAIRC
jgi:hypothetical protein